MGKTTSEDLVRAHVARLYQGDDPIGSITALILAMAPDAAALALVRDDLVAQKAAERDKLVEQLARVDADLSVLGW